MTALRHDGGSPLDDCRGSANDALVPRRVKHLVLVGAGAAHRRLLRALAREPMPGARITLVAPHERAWPGRLLADWVAGRRRSDEATVSLPPLVAAARAEGVEADVAALDAASRELRLADGSALRCDVLSIDAEPWLARDAIAGAREHAVFVHPRAVFARLWEAVLALAAGRSLCVVVIGGGARAAELAIALQLRLAERARVSWVAGGDAPLADAAPALRQRLLQALRRLDITLLAEPAVAITATQVQLASGVRVACDAPFIAGGAALPPWLAASGVALGERGRIAVRETLHSTTHPWLFAVGDAADSGIDSHAAGAALALNLRRRVAGGELQPLHAARRRLEWFVSGERCAIAAWGERAVEGRWVWVLKQRADRRAWAADGGTAAPPPPAQDTAPPSVAASGAQAAAAPEPGVATALQTPPPAPEAPPSEVARPERDHER